MKKSFIVFTTFITTILVMNSIAYGTYVNHSNKMNGSVKQVAQLTNEQQIVEAYKRFYSAFVRGDINTMFVDYDTGYSIFTSQGVINQQQIRQNILDWYRKGRRLKVHYKINDLYIRDGSATVVLVEYLSGTIANPQNPQVQVPFSKETQYSDIWGIRPWGWKRVNSQILQEKIAGGLQYYRPQQRQRQVQTGVTCSPAYLRQIPCNYAANTNCVGLQGTYARPCP
jgi:hypothetical protein